MPTSFPRYNTSSEKTQRQAFKPVTMVSIQSPPLPNLLNRLTLNEWDRDLGSNPKGRDRSVRPHEQVEVERRLKHGVRASYARVAADPTAKPTHASDHDQQQESRSKIRDVTDKAYAKAQDYKNTTSALLGRSWRDRNDPEVKRLAEKRISFAPTIRDQEEARKSGSKRSSWNPSARTVSGMAVNEQQPGTIVFHWGFKEVKEWKVIPGDDSFVRRGGRYYHKKGRYWLIFANSNDVVEEYGVYTYGGLGLRNFSTADKAKYCSLRPLNPSDGFRNQSSANRVLQIEWMMPPRPGDDDAIVEHRDTCVVDFSVVHKRPADIPCLNVRSMIDQESIRIMERMHEKLKKTVVVSESFYD
ncbi:hypothetical protein K431DRAFT_120064 [Polychaeton citri CBS 116435]|uniref:Uncharacterized protein n=1 Tax=Polychaeton citri CBS 116435 TaxID=1314669 RepID=A0A9P4Q6U4_9PEZI|nr:hypothetical protein K431DRAFT_120064 [Polychaeton citri CBS 116435]